MPLPAASTDTLKRSGDTKMMWIMKASNISIQLKNSMLDSSDQVLFVAVFNDFKAVSVDCSIHKSAAIWLFKHLFIVPLKAVIKASVVILTQTAETQERCSTSRSTVVNFLFERYVISENMAMVDGDICQFRKLI